MERAYRQFTLGSGLVIAAVGVAMVAVTLSRDGGPLSLGVVFGVCFTLFGAGRAYMARGGA